MKTYEGESHYGYERPYSRELKPPPQEVSRKTKYNLRRVSNMKRDKDTFQLNKSLDTRLEEKNYDVVAFNESQMKHNQMLNSQLTRAETYTSCDKERPNSSHRDFIRTKSAHLKIEGKGNKLKASELSKLIRLKKRENIEIRNKWQDYKHYEANSYLIMTTALRRSDMNFQKRREAESLDRLASQEAEKIEILASEAKQLAASISKEMKRVDELEKINKEANRRILEKQKVKKEMEEVLRKQEAIIKNLNSKIESLIIEEQGYKKIIEGFIRDTS